MPVNNNLDYESPEAEERWCDEERSAVAAYLKDQNLNHGDIGSWPAWHLCPYVAVWAIESVTNPGWIGWWAISGDLPTDYISAGEVEPPQHPRKALRVFARKWMALSEAMREGRSLENYSIGSPRSPESLAPLLSSRAVLLAEFCDDDLIWEED